MSHQTPVGRFLPLQGAESEVLPNMVLHWYSHPRLGQNTELLFVRVQMPPGQAHEFHFHPKMEEILYILSGVAEEWIAHDKRIVQSGDVICIPAGIVHATYNTGNQPFEFLAVLSPANSAEPATVDVFQEEPWRSLRSRIN